MAQAWEAQEQACCRSGRQGSRSSSSSPATAVRLYSTASSLHATPSISATRHCILPIKHLNSLLRFVNLSIDCCTDSAADRCIGMLTIERSSQHLFQAQPCLPQATTYIFTCRQLQRMHCCPTSWCTRQGPHIRYKKLPVKNAQSCIP